MVSTSLKRYRDIKKVWGDFDREYYILLNCVDRLINLLKDKYGTLSKASIAMGYKSKVELQHRLKYKCIVPNFKGLKRICKALNISFDYAIFGEGLKEYKHSDTLSFNNFIETYNNYYWLNKHPLITQSIYDLSINKRQYLPLKYIIKVARDTHKSIDELVE